MHRTPPDFARRIHTTQRVTAIVETLAVDGIPPSESLVGSGLDEAALTATDTRVSYTQIATIFRNALHLSPDPTLALRAGLRMHLTAFGMYGYALLSSPTFADAMAFGDKCHRAMGPLADYTRVRAKGVEIFRYDGILSTDPHDGLYRFSLEFKFAEHMTLFRDLYGESFAFAAVRAAYPAPEHQDAYRSLFRCPVSFDQPANELEIRAPWFDRKPRLPDAVTHRSASEICRQFLSDQAATTGVASSVRQALVDTMPWHFPRIETMAAALSMHPRTLRRRLEAEGTSYRDVLAQVRQRLAIDYLRNTRMTNEEIAGRLGYSDAANFRHAFVRWTGKSPQEYRQR
ncbi:MAG: AraC family transcriptional regulator ligand-binding domain-containing protein [Burkholderiaceae bacterium]